MKNTLKFAALAIAAALLAVSCKPKSDIEGFTKTKSGLHYKYIAENGDGYTPQDGDVLICHTAIYYNETLLDTGMGSEPFPAYLVGAQSRFKGDFDEGFKIMHVGEELIIAVSADSLARVGMPMPPEYKEGTHSTIRIYVNLTGIKKKAEIEKEQAEFSRNAEAAKAQEPELINAYLAENNITVAPTSDGIYIVKNRKGNGPKVEGGKKVKVNYTGRFLDGTVFDTSDPNVGENAHEALEYTVGEDPLIRGWELAMATLRQGDRATVIIPSNLAYGAGTKGIPPYSTLVFDMEVLSVK